MKKNIIIIVLILIIIGLSITVVFKNNNEKIETENSNSNKSNITSNHNSDLNSNDTSNSYNSNITSNVIDSNSNVENSNINSNSNSNKTSNITSNVTSNKNSTSNKTSSNKQSNSTSNVQSNKQNTSLSTNGSFSGIFKLNDCTLTIYQINSSKLHYSFLNNKLNSRYSGNADISNKKANIIASSNYTLTLTSTGVTLQSGNNVIPSGIYPKTKNYTSREYYSDNIGDLRYENSSYNGIFKGPQGTIKLFQKNVTDVQIIFNTTKNYSTTLTISNGVLTGKTAQGDINIKIINNGIEVTTSSDSAGSALFYATGKYVKEKKYTIEQIVSDLG